MKLFILYEGRIRLSDVKLIKKTLANNKMWLKQFGIDANKSGKYVGDEGGVGAALFFGDKVVKLTGDKSEFLVAKKLVGKSIPNLTTIYGATTIGDIDNDNKPEYMIVMEKISTNIPGQLRTAGEILYDYLEEILPYDGIGGVDNFKSKSIKEIYSDIEKVNVKSKTDKRTLARKFQNNKTIRTLVMKLIVALKNIYENTGILLIDTHGRNLGFKGSDITLFDVGRAF